MINIIVHNRKEVMSRENNVATFSVRVTEDEKALLAMIAKLDNTNVAALARQYILDGMDRELDPAEIERKVDLEKARLLAAVEKIRNSR